jgi:uncharacterized protein
LELTREHPGQKVYIRAVGKDGITIGEDKFTSSLILSPDTVNPDWGVDAFADISAETLQPLLDLDPELVLIGTGAQQHFPTPETLMMFYRAGIGVEIMNTRAACRTFNILVLEERRVVAGLIPPET